ncbi:MAG: PAS-domain containing protein [Rhizobiaceae bacterium]|nr:PAS-domain containing protein [Rhizobiaceae bacterium]
MRLLSIVTQIGQVKLLAYALSITFLSVALFSLGYTTNSVFEYDTNYVFFFLLSFMCVLISGLPVLLYLQGKRRDRTILRDFLRQKKSFNTMLTTMRQGFCMFDEDNNVIISNDRYATIYGLLPKHTKPGKNLLDIVENRIKNGCFIGTQPSKYIAAMEQLKGNRTGVPRTYQLNDGRYVEICDQPVSDGIWFTTHEDVTERIEAELKIKDQNEKFDTALSNISQGLCMFDGDKTLIVSNECYATIFGLAPEMIKPGMHLSEIIKLRIEHGSFVGENPKDYISRADEWITSLFDVDEVHQLTDGRYIKILFHPMADGGWLSTQEDVTERTEARMAIALQNNQFDIAISNISQGLCLFDADKKLIVSNDLFATIFGLSPEVIKPGMHLTEIIHKRVKFGSYVDDGASEVGEWQSGATDKSEIFQLTDGRSVEILFRPMAGGGWLSTQEDVTDRVTAKNELVQQNRCMDAALRAMTQGLCMYDSDKNIVVSNDQYSEIYGISPGLIKPGTSLDEVVRLRIEQGTYSGSSPEEYHKKRSNWVQTRDSKPILDHLNDGRYIEIRHHPTGDDGWLLTHDDVTDRVNFDAALSEQVLRLDTAISAMSHGLSMFDGDENIIVSNERYAAIYGLKADQIKPGMALKDIIELRIQHGSYIGDNPEEYRRWMMDPLKRCEGKPETYVLSDGRYVEIHLHTMANGGWLTVHEDVTERYESEKKIKYLADFDALTGLPNRTQIHDILETTIQQANEDASKMALIYIDLDRFKEVNDTLGHPIGDDVLKEVGHRLTQFLNDKLIAGRLSGDEFVVIVREFDSLKELSKLADQICASLSIPIHVKHEVIDISASIGISVGPPNNGEVDLLIQFSDLALYQAKAAGGNCYRFFEEKMYAQAKERQRMAIDLRNAISNDELVLHYQAQVDLRSGKINGYEALVRWQHPELGMVSPLQFIGLAEETGQISEIGEWVLRTACEYAVTWPNKENISVNLSPVQFKRQDVVAMVKTILEETGLDPRRLELEITEGILIQSIETVTATLQTLDEMGVAIALDDFGTGFSSLSYLTTFPFKKIKIDKSFIDDLGKDSEVTAIVSMIIGLGRSLGTMITAEGIEYTNQHELLRAAGCDQGQGYLYSKPVPKILESDPPIAQTVNRRSA